MYEFLERIFHEVVSYGILAIESVGVIMLLVTAVRALITVFRNHVKSRHMLADGVTTSLSFLLAGEVLKTIQAPDWHDMGMTCAVLLMRAGMAVLIHWEHTHETDVE